jgi:hypothetical protein
MSAEQIQYNQSLLASVSSQNPALNEIAAQANQYTEMCKAGQITPAELTEALRDLQGQLQIQSNMAELDSMETLNTAINGLITVASLFG